MIVRTEGDSAAIARWSGPGASTRGTILSIHRRLLAVRPVWLVDLVPGASSLLAVIDPLLAAPGDAQLLLEAPGEPPGSGSEAAPRTIEVPVVYGGEEGPDLDRVAKGAGLTPAEVVRLHTAAAYEVAFLGFAPGFPYLAGLPEKLAAPRLASPRARVPAGSVGIAGGQTGIYPRSSPGGWNLIGRTPLALFDLRREEPFLLRPGDRVRFRPISQAVFEDAPALVGHAAGDLAAGGPHVLEVLAAGLLTTVQDLGRRGFAHLGVPPSGCLDPLALRIANLAVGNAPGAAVMEATFPGPQLRFLECCSFALAGADLGARLSGRTVPRHERVEARAGDELRFAEPLAGQWAYLALAGGIAAPMNLGSASADLRSGIGRRIGARDRIQLAAAPRSGGRRTPLDAAPLPAGVARVRIVRDPGDEPSPIEGLELVLSGTRDRSGYRTESPAIARGEGSLPSEGIAPGTVQLPPDGRAIFLLSERPATGGYRKAAFVAAADLRIVAQSAPGGRLRLVPVTVEEARRLIADQEAIVGFGDSRIH